MKKFRVILLVVLAMLLVTSTAYAAPLDSKNFLAFLSGAQEVPPRETDARGFSFLHLNPEETGLFYTVIVHNIENVFAAHIHCAPPGENGPVGITLFSGSPGGGPVHGILARGIATAPDADNACGWATLADAVEAMRSGNTYVNVHTNDGVDPPDTGPGDFPGGEIRGQVREVGLSQ